MFSTLILFTAKFTSLYHWLYTLLRGFYERSIRIKISVAKISLMRIANAELAYIVDSWLFRSLFTVFVRYILEERNASRELDRHWRPQSEICRPCLVNYDFIGHYETLYPDADYVLNLLADRLPLSLNLTDSTISNSGNEPEVKRVRFPRFDPDNNVSSSTLLTESMLSELTKDDIEGLYELYEDDLRLFGYQKRFDRLWCA